MATISLDSLDLAALLCSRVCHDVISPVGAIVNGLEVLEDDNDASMRDFALDLIQKSAKQASARLQFARLAFGAAGSAGASIDLGDAEQVARGLFLDDKISFSWSLAAAAVPEEPGEASPQPDHDRHHGHPARRLDCGDRHRRGGVLRVHHRVEGPQCPHSRPFRGAARRKFGERHRRCSRHPDLLCRHGGPRRRT